MLRLDRVLVAAAALLVLAIGADAVRSHLRHRGAAPRPPAPTTTRAVVPIPRDADSEMSDPGLEIEAPVPEHVRLVPSSTAFLQNCTARSLRLSLDPGPVLALRYDGPPCHVPPLHLLAVVRDAKGRLVYRGPALEREDLSGNVAGAHVARAPLAIGCRSLPLYATVSGYGLSADGPVRCRGAG